MKASVPLPERYAKGFDKRWWFGRGTPDRVIATIIREALTEVRTRVHDCPHQPLGCDDCWGLGEVK